MHRRALEQLRLPWKRLPREGAMATCALSEWLYGEYFIAWQPRPRHEYSGSPWFVAELNARCGGTTFEPGFRVVERVGEGAFVEHHGISLWVARRKELRPANARAGQAVEIALPCARESAIPGFFTIVSRAGRIDAAAPHLKLYVNATPQAALAVLEGLLGDRSLRAARFEAKVTNDPMHFGRRDTLLVYVTPEHAGRVAHFLRRFERALLAPTPPMTAPLSRGVAIAESPIHAAESFGAHRCRLVAEGLITARAEGRPTHLAIAERFEREGLDWEAPWFGALPRDWLSELPRARRSAAATSPARSRARSRA